MKKWIIISIAFLGLDQITKILVSIYAPFKTPVPIIKGVLNIYYTHNTGVAFGLFQGITQTYTIILAIFALVALSIFGYMLVKNDFSDKKTKWYSLALALLIAGTLGNAIDRLFQPGNVVIDFIDFAALGNLWGYTFNFADVYLNVGMALLFIDIFFLEPKRKKTNYE